MIFNVKLTPEVLLKREMKLKTNPFLYMHGMGSSSDDLFLNGEQASIGFHLVNKGFDIWAGNFRGNKYSHSHINKNISAKDFFDFSWQEMGEYDLPAIYDYVLKQTKVEKLIYAGYSQGTTAMFASQSDTTTSDFIQKRSIKMFMFAPVVFLTHIGSELFEYQARFRKLIDQVANGIKFYEIASSDCQMNDTWDKILEAVCNLDPTFCSTVPGWIGINIDPKVDTFFEKKAQILAHVPCGTSIRLANHYGQQIDNNEKKYGPRFQKYDFGIFGNLAKYGQYTAPFYDLNLIGDIEIVFMSGENDLLGNPTDVDHLVERVQNGKNKLYIEREFEHCTFAMMKDPEVVFGQLDDELKDFN